MKNTDFLQIAENYGTPCFVFDEVSLRKRMEKIAALLASEVGLCYSIKANPFLVGSMLPFCKRVEVCSPGELDICKRLGVAAEKVLYSGLNKGQKDVEEAVSYGAAELTAESIRHVRLINDAAMKFGKRVSVLLRLNAGSQFGMSKKDLCWVLENRAQFPGVDICGIHYHSGTQRKKLAAHEKELGMLQEFFREAETQYGITLRKLEYGPGLGVSYFEGEDFSDTTALLAELLPRLQSCAKWCELTIELGRFLVAECGYYVTGIVDTKENEGTNYCVLDGGMNHLNYYGQIMGMKVPVIRHIKKGTDTQEKPWCLCGSLCTLADVIVRSVTLEGAEVEDLLVFANAGAYTVTEGINLFLSRSLPWVLLKTEDKIVVLRKMQESSVLNTAQI